MTAISLERPARPSQLGMRGITAAVKLRRLPRSSGRYLVGSVQLRGSVASRPQEFASGFVDFLLGRGARHSQRQGIVPATARGD
jgi:hypothetical protein